MTYLAKEYFRDLMEEKVTEQEFAHADRHICKENRFFPVMADIMVGVKEYREDDYRDWARRSKWLTDNAWRKNFPEMLSHDDRIDLGVSVGAMETALDWGQISQAEFDRFVNDTQQGQIT